MSERKTYAPPQIFQVELNQDQAILSTCRTGTTNFSTVTRARGFCDSVCKRASLRSGTTNSGNHPS